jgi:hypothetical protein
VLCPAFYPPKIIAREAIEGDNASPTGCLKRSAAEDGQMAKTSETPTGRKRRVHEQLWNDDLFRNRVLMLSLKRGLSPRAAMREAGFTVDYADREMEMRNSNQLMVLADYFGVSPTYLCGWPNTYNDNPDEAAPRKKRRNAAASPPTGVAHDPQATAEYREWLGQLILEMVRIAQRGAGDVYGIAERVLTAGGLEGVHPPRSPSDDSADGAGS